MLSVLKTNIKIIFFIGYFVLVVSNAGFTDQNRVLYKGHVNTFKLNIRETPSNNSRVVNVAEKGETIDVIQLQGDIGGWLTIVYKGSKGYIRNRPQDIQLIPIPKQQPFEQPEKQNKKLKKIKNKENQKIQEKIQNQEKIVETFSQKEIEIIEGLNEIDYALNKARAKALALSTEIMHLEERILQLKHDREVLSKDIEINREYAGERLKALYKMKMIGRLNIAGMPSPIFDFFLEQHSMKLIISADYDLLEKQNLALEKLEILEQEFQKEIRTKTGLETELNDQIRMNKTETLKKEMILKQIRQKKKLSLAAVDALKQAALQLDNRINCLQKSSVLTPGDGSFLNYKGRLIIPARGEIVSIFGTSGAENYKSFTFQKGIDIKVERGEPVKSVFKGKVMFAQWLSGYGNLLIINHGDNYYTLYAHVEEIFKKKGETVETGEVIATAGDTGSIKGMCLHFELRHHGKPVNPMEWLRKGA
ncbi:peptidoglycan DD-metalloendopeptidase family protein [Desulfobacula toluolica]|uniref:peptidoglycan DD-metalloendopeptidase family protein n=1 Tax=Desulfobacula toluolica TaxID=28223 RepID=UPI0003081E08|nr:peptidoglycan DD-metalloendopeptidase family protein [Desulfobacula toluolica]